MSYAKKKKSKNWKKQQDCSIFASFLETHVAELADALL